MRIVVIKWIKSRTLRERRHLYIHVNRDASAFTALISRGSGFDARNRVKLKGHQCRTPSRSNISTNYFRVATEETEKNFIRSYRENAYTWKRANIRRIYWNHEEHGGLRPLVISARDGKQKGKRKTRNEKKEKKREKNYTHLRYPSTDRARARVKLWRVHVCNWKR